MALAAALTTVARAFKRCLERLQATQVVVLLAEPVDVARTNNVLASHVGRVHPQLACHHVHVGFHREYCLRFARTTHVASGDTVRVHVVSCHPSVGDVVRPDAVAWARKEPQRQEACVCSRVVGGDDVCRQDGSVVLDARPDVNARWVARVGRRQLFTVVHHHEHRLAGGSRQEVRDGYVHLPTLATEVTTDSGVVDVDGLRVYVRRLRDITLQSVRALVGGPYIHLPIVAAGHQTGMGFHVRLVHHRGRVRALDDDV